MNIFNTLIQLLLGKEAQKIELSEWRDILNVARSAGVLPRMACIVLENDLQKDVPDAVLNHLRASQRHVVMFHNQVENELTIIADILTKLGDEKVVLLKGAGYVHSKSEAAKGRIFSDIDILVSAEMLPKIELRLNLLGWVSDVDDYDQNYYRKWAHEIPPMRNVKRGTVLDIHHNIVPMISGRAPCSSLLLDEAEPEFGNLVTLSKSAMFVHSAIHLFFKEEFNFGFRDLTDLLLLYYEIEGDKEDLRNIWVLAKNLGFELEVYLGLRYLHLVLGVDVSSTLLKLFEAVIPNRVSLILFDWMYIRVLAPEHSLVKKKFTWLASMSAFLRGHFMKMPLHILIKHAGTKTLNNIVKSIAGDVSRENGKSNV